MEASGALDVAVEAVRAAGAIQKARYGTALTVRHKGAVDLVTEVDLACEEAIRDILARRSPGTAILGEEGGKTGEGSRVWIVDPLDGTTNFAHGVPVFCATVALEEDGAVVAGATYDPLRGELFTAQRGRGAFLDGHPLRVSPQATLNDGLLATGFAYTYRDDPRNFGAFADLTRASQGVRRLGSAALDLAYVAAGRFEAYWEADLKPWDVAAGRLLVEEAGGVVTGFSGAPYDHYMPAVAASNGLVHAALLDVLKTHF